jgi:hypothetical protein
MDQDRNKPNPAANKSKAEGDRWGSEADTVERLDRDTQRQKPEGETGGITNRPLEEEENNQDRVPDRGDAREGAHAGHGDRNARKQEDR